MQEGEVFYSEVVNMSEERKIFGRYNKGKKTLFFVVNFCTSFRRCVRMRRIAVTKINHLSAKTI
jgi:hypothetical protein